MNRLSAAAPRAGRTGGDATESWTAQALGASVGEWLVVAAGLIAYGAYEIVQARYRAIRSA